MDKLKYEPTSSSIPKSTSNGIPTSTEAASKPIQIPVLKQTNCFGVSDSYSLVGSPGTVKHSILSSKLREMKDRDNTARQTTSLQNQGEVKSQDNPDPHNSDTSEMHAVFEIDL